MLQFRSNCRWSFAMQQHDSANMCYKAGDFCRCPDQWATAKVACFVIHRKVIEVAINAGIT
nr:MAG TPA: hypothetical protein [Caudoviricetes sp.]